MATGDGMATAGSAWFVRALDHLLPTPGACHRALGQHATLRADVSCGAGLPVGRSHHACSVGVAWLRGTLHECRHCGAAGHRLLAAPRFARGRADDCSEPRQHERHRRCNAPAARRRGCFRWSPVWRAVAQLACRVVGAGLGAECFSTGIRGLVTWGDLNDDPTAEYPHHGCERVRGGGDRCCHRCQCADGARARG